MASLLYQYFSMLLLASLLSTHFTPHAQLLPQQEVETLKIISSKLKNTYWKSINRESCNDGGNRSFNTYFAPYILSNVTCNCSFSEGTVCHVTNIQLNGLNVTGVFPEEFGNLSHLQEIDFSRNYIKGSIPKSLANIPLAILSLVGNPITGVIPEEIAEIATLQEIVFEDNQLGGPLPASLGNLKNLKRLVLAGNYFNGTIPETYANLKNLNELRLSGNPISGKMPEFIGSLSNLSTLDFQGTSMVGSIPSSFSLLTNLEILRISDLSTGSMPFPNLTSMTNLKYLVLRNCLLTGQIPFYIQKLSNLSLIDLSYNQLSGPVPESMENLKKLEFLFLTNNSLSGSVPYWLENSKYKFDVSYNNFTGSSNTLCQEPNVNMVSSYSSAKNNSVNWCLMKDLPCTSKAKYHSLFINCGGGKMRFEGKEYEEDSSPLGPSTFNEFENWAYSSTGTFLYRDSAAFLAMASSDSNVTGIYRTARLAPISLKYYGLCMLKGSYTVKLHFAEIMFADDDTFSSNGRRFFDVAIQGVIVLKNFNIAAKAGGAGKAIVMEFKNVYVNDSTLRIFLYWAGKGTTGAPDRGAYGPLISAISVTPNFKITKGLSGGAIAGIVLTSSAMLVSILILLRMKGYLGRKGHGEEEFWGLATGYFSLRQIKAATDDFSIRNKIGEGGFGPVYKRIYGS